MVFKQNDEITDNDASDGYAGPDKEEMFALIDTMFASDPDRAENIKAGVNWSPERFAVKNGLGDLIAGNFWQTQWSDDTNSN